ncbi:MAG: hypothetical protein J7L94_16900 [Caldisericaceae bacterium]|nr:hypothetical protein [Caldisericaceae bacterium]
MIKLKYKQQHMKQLKNNNQSKCNRDQAKSKVAFRSILLLYGEEFAFQKEK